MTLSVNPEATPSASSTCSGMPSPSDALDDLCLDEQPRKLAVLGLPWETTEDTLRLHFSQYGVVEAAEIMKDRFTGKSRGFGFVTFVDPNSASRALTLEHTIDGRRCEAKVALPKALMQGEMVTPRTTRIFVARIPASVTESQFRGYFEKYGRLQDAYMPKDHSKQAYRGIGFVTFASPDSVEKVMANKHWMNGHEVAIDRATPKDEAPGKHFMRPTGPVAAPQRRSFDNGSGLVGPGLTPLFNYQPMGGMAADPAAAAFTAMRALSGERDALAEFNAFETMAAAAAAAANAAAAAADVTGRASFDGAAASLGMATTAGLTEEDLGKCGAGKATTSGSLGLFNGLGGHNNLPNAAMLQNMQNMQNIAKAHAALNGLQVSGLGPNMLGGLGGDMGGSLLGPGAGYSSKPPGVGGRKSLDSAMHHIQPPQPSRRSMESPAIVNARSGPRIFIGKLTKDTSEADVKEYFSRFGYVMDVYMPKAKDNKAEHRGFGFVTFETDAAIKRVVGAGSHKLKGSTIAIDIAIPKVEEEIGGDLSAAFANAGLGGPMSNGPGSLGPLQPYDAATAAAAAAIAARQFQAALPMLM